MIIATIGIPLSKKLGTKYIFRGIRLFIPFILIIILIVAIGSIVPSIAVGSGTISNYLQNVINPIISSPFGGQSTTSISESGITAQINTQWGLGSGAWLLLIAGIIMLVAGILELMAKTQFFATKIPLPGQGPARMPVQPPPTPPQKQEPPKDKSKGNFCTGCGAKLEENSTFCVKCGKKIGK
jgi:membrane protease subunit (stomatin/prohibitin family)